MLASSCPKEALPHMACLILVLVSSVIIYFSGEEFSLVYHQSAVSVDSRLRALALQQLWLFVSSKWSSHADLWTEFLVRL